ncbi:MAG: 4Fe-4S dicluster domain-containing protein [Candidatus Brocadiae bacterium]|nr:4Fe-4S dicluster domain-containing protein [Candidatus Brocadiia bacterium]
MTPSHEIEARLRETAEELLREKRVDLFLGYEKATLPFRTTPLFLTSPEEVERLAWNPFCTTNLAVYLPRLFKAPASAREAERAPPLPTVAVVLKGCDARSAIALVQERQVPREKLVLVGVACPGMVDVRKAERALGEHEALGAGEDALGNIHVVVEDGREVTLPREEIVADACLECRAPTPSLPDVLVGEPVEGKDPDGARRQTDEFASKTLDDRWAHLQDELSKCIRCNACRQACPMCYCKECLLDQTRPRWVGTSTDMSDVTIYHLVRAFHMAGRCTECGACARACSMGIDTRLLTRKLGQEVEDLYGYRSGESADVLPALSAFDMDDAQDFLTEP